MFTPQRKVPWTPPSSAPRTLTGGPRFSTTDKGKSVAFFDGPPPLPPPRSSFDGEVVRRGENAEDWKRFKEVGLLDESSLERKDRQALLDRISKLEKELFDYQYNMGLLLIEKKDVDSRNTELGQEFAEAQEILKREQNAHLIAISEVEQREENLKKALDIEKKCSVDLQRALSDMYEEKAKFKVSSESTVEDVNTRMEALEKKRLDLEAKSHLADSKLAAADRKISEVDMKLQDLDVRENILQRERLSLAEEKEAHQTYFQKHKKDLIEWERKLQEGEQRLCDSRRFLKEREEKLHETDRSSKEKEAYLDELQQKIDLADGTLKKMEHDIEIKLADLEAKEKEAEAMRSDLEITEKKLLEKEERLSARESEELETLLSKHKTELDAKMHEFELEMKQKRISTEEELSTRMQEIDQRKTEINHLEEMLGKRTQALEKKSERVKEKEKEVEGKIKALKEREKSVKAEEKRLELEKKEVNGDKEGLEDLKKELDTWQTNLRKQEIQIEEERKELLALEEERSNYLRLQTNLKQEIENARRQSELIEKEAEDLKLQREKFEKDWEALDEKRAYVDNKLKMLAEERASFEKLQFSEEDRLKRERAEREEDLRLQSERIRLEKESFEATMDHQKKMYDEQAKNEHSIMLRDFERERQDYYDDMQKREKEWEEMMEKKERAFEERKLRETGSVSHLKDEAERKKTDMETERHRLEKEREEMELIKKQLEETRVEMSADVEALDKLSKTMKKQREEFASQRHLFSAFIEKIKGCTNCGDSAQAFLHRIVKIPGLEAPSHFPSTSHHDDRNSKDEVAPRQLSAKASLSPVPVNGINLKSGGQMIRKCASLIFKSPKDKSQPTDDRIAEDSPSSAIALTASKIGASGIQHNPDERKLRTQDSAIDERGLSYGTANGSLKDSPSDFIVREDTSNISASVDVSNIASAEQGFEDSQNTDAKTGKRKPVRKRGPGVRGSKTVKALVEDVKTIAGKESVRNLEPNDFQGAEVNNQGESVQTEPKLPASARKRSRSQASRATESEQDLDQSEGIADSATTGGRRKRRQTAAPALPTPGQRRYNLRRHTVADTPVAEQAPVAEPKNKDEVASKGSDRVVQNPDDMPSQSLDDAGNSGTRLNLVQVSTTRSIEISSHRVVKLATGDVADNQFDTAAKSAENASLSVEATSGEDTLMTEEVNENEDDLDDDGSSSDGSSADEGEDAEDGDDDDSDGHPGQASVGKKLWNFFTT